MSHRHHRRRVSPTFNTIAAACIMLLAAGLAPAQTPEDDDDPRPPAERLAALFGEYGEWYHEQYPDEAMDRGDFRYADRVTDISLRAIEERHRDRERFLRELRRIDRDALTNAEDRLNFLLFEEMLALEIEGHRFREHLMQIGGRSGMQQSIPQMGRGARFSNAEDYENYLTRIEQTPRLVDSTLEALRLGLEEGRTPPKVTLEGVAGQFEIVLDGGALAMLGEPLQKMPASIPDEKKAELLERFEQRSLPAVRDAMERLRRYTVEEYIPRTRETISAAEYPDGEAYYTHQLRVMTTLDLSPKEVHEIGIAEVQRIRSEMMEVIRRSDYFEHHPQANELSEDDLFALFIDYLRTDRRFYYQSADDLIAGYRAICKEVDGHMPRYFGTLPRLPYGVREIPRFMAPSQTTAYYNPGSLEIGEPGWFEANTYRLDQRPKYEMIALAMHEAVPGHHHQIAIAQELEHVPEFRMTMWITAFGEGWALYSERLGIEMGLYTDPYDDFGRLLYEMWRACRLVVDPGIHAFGWSREEAIAYMARNTALSELNIENEIDRYIAWPGQACAYKLGELKIRALRERAEEALGERFDVRDFHDVILTAGPLPLRVLDQRVEEWIAAQSDDTSREDGP